MKRALIPAAVVAVGVLIFAVVNATAGSSRSKEGGTIHVIEHADTDTVTNGSGDSVGNILTFANPIFDSSNTNKVGSDQGYCVRIEVGESWECVWTTILAGGQITVEGPFLDTSDSTLAITGGTGAYRNVRGSMELKSRAGGTEFDFIFRLIG
jgi:allene oxide cyclase